MNNFVFDTSVLVSAALLANSTTRKALDKTLDLGTIAVSKSTLEEFIEVLFRKKLDKYFFNDQERWMLINTIEINTQLFIPDVSIKDCRDPKDNKFLELAVFANAACIVSGDNDLLILHPFRGIPILNATDFLNNF